MTVKNLNNPPVMPVGNKIVDAQGNLTPSWEYFFSQLTTFLQSNVNSEGIHLPEQPNANLTGTGILNNINAKGDMVYNSDNDTMMVNLNGTFKTVQTV